MQKILTKWPYLLGIILVSFFVSLVVMDWNLGLLPSDSGRGFEINTARIVGYSGGTTLWHVRADYVWAGRSRSLFNLESVHDGQFCDPNGREVLEAFSAKKLRVNSRLHMISAENGIEAKVAREALHISSDRLTYIDGTKEVILSGLITLKHADMTILPNDTLVYNVSSNKAIMSSGATMESAEFIVSTNHMIMYPDDHIVTLENGVQGKRKPLSTREAKAFRGDPRELALRQKATKFSSDQMSYSLTNGTNNVHLLGNVSVTQPGKSITAHSGIYKRVDRTFAVSGNVRFSTDSLGWMQDKRRKKTIKNTEFKDAMNASLVLTSDALDMNFSDHSFTSSGKVTIIQPNRKIICDQLTYNDKLQRFELEGNIQVFRKKDIMHSQNLTVDLENETVGIEQNVDMEFRL
jgi:lipopolysaccharide assembly outer membrane protein LptD (OstA)